MADSPLCAYAGFVADLTALGLHPLDTGNCEDAATHAASGQIRRPGRLLTVSVLVCVWHAEKVRRTPIPHFVALPHTVLTGARP
jgi:hypothetical protein